MTYADDHASNPCNRCQSPPGVHCEHDERLHAPPPTAAPADLDAVEALAGLDGTSPDRWRGVSASTVSALIADLRAARAEIARLTDDLAAAREVPADVEVELDSLRPHLTGGATLDYLRAAIARAIAAARSEAPATVGGLLATAANPHPDGCHSTSPAALRDCDTDGHMSCPTCTRNTRGPLPGGEW